MKSVWGNIEVCGLCGGSARVIVDGPNRCIEGQNVIDRILVHLREKEQETPALALLTPPPGTPTATLSIFAGKDTVFSQFNQQGRH